MKWWPFRRKRVARDLSAVLAQKADAQKRLTDAQRRLEHDEVFTTRPLRVMMRENHVSDHLDSLVRKVRERGGPGSAYP